MLFKNSTPLKALINSSSFQLFSSAYTPAAQYYKFMKNNMLRVVDESDFDYQFGDDNVKPYYIGIRLVSFPFGALAKYFAGPFVSVPNKTALLFDIFFTVYRRLRGVKHK